MGEGVLGFGLTLLVLGLLVVGSAASDGADGGLDCAGGLTLPLTDDLRSSNACEVSVRCPRRTGWCWFPGERVSNGFCLEWFAC